MKQKQIKFFSLADNTEEKKKPIKEEVVIAKAHITSNGKLTLPLSTLQQLGIQTEQTRFKIGVDQQKKSFVGLYLVPVESTDETSFGLVKIGRGYALLLKGIFKKLGLDYKNTQYQFVVKAVDLAGEAGFFAKLTEQAPREKTGDSETEE